MTVSVKPSAQRGLFIGQRRDRLGARLLMMLTCMRLAEDFGTDYRINWFPKNADAPELDNPAELFDPEWMARHFLTNEEYEKLDKTALPVWHFKDDPDPSRLMAHLAQGRTVIVEEGFEVFCFPWEDEDAIRTRYRDYIHTITFEPYIAGEMSKIHGALSQKGSCAYHIRRGDILNGLPWKHSTWNSKIEPEEYYHAHMKLLGDTPAVMFSDQPETLAAFKARYPNLMTIQDITDLSQRTRAQRDFLELYAISCADHIVAPIISAFSMAAARVSGREREMFSQVLDKPAIKEANDALTERLNHDGDNFVSVSERAHLYSKAHQYLTANGRFDEAYEIAKDILDNGADNAFMPLLQALNCAYLNRYDEGKDVAKAGLNNPHLWPEDFAALTAVLAMLLGSQGRRWGGSVEVSRAFWAKPMRPDVIVMASRMLYRNQIAARLFPPIDWDVLKSVRQPWFPPFNNLYLVQHQMMKRRPCNWDVVLLDWHELALDRKATRLLQDSTRLSALENGLKAQSNIEPSAPAYISLQATLRFRLGGSLDQAIDATRRAIAGAPKSVLYRKRLADLMEAAGDMRGAHMEWCHVLAEAPENPFTLFTMAQFFQRFGDSEQATSFFLAAAKHDEHSAMIQGTAGQLYLQNDEAETALPYLERARDLYPTYNRFKNQLKRAEAKVGA